jgi:hypothetical protein
MKKRTVYTQIHIGAKFNRIEVLEDLGIVDGKRMIRGKCDCGKEKFFFWQNVKSGKAKSCGCLPIEKHTIHGLHKHPLYSVWEGMVHRCYNKNGKKYHRYGGRGVIMCREWKNDFMSFYNWAIDKWKPGLSLDKDKLAPTKLGVIYCPEFCCFMTRKENTMYRSNSRVITYKGESLCVSQWAEKFGINYQTFQGRLSAGWTMEEIESIPLFKYSKKSA